MGYRVGQTEIFIALILTLWATPGSAQATPEAVLRACSHVMLAMNSLDSPSNGLKSAGLGPVVALGFSLHVTISHYSTRSI